ncbi:MAG TPA: hypothetical protein VG322_12485 [Candidatus Acidoferrales bacterium]|nr:hypothetical protein [Candidatus Acidoferrales bacterium]
MLVSMPMASLAQSSNAGAEAQPQAQSSNKPAGAKATQSGTKCCSASPTTKAAAPTAKPADPNVVACHALEVHTNAQPAITILVFNQKNRDDHERLSDLLKDNEGASVEVKASDGTWHKASVARLRSCFGRGLLFFSGESSPVEEKDDFVLRFPAKKTS